MMENIKITCDNCERDITYTGNSIDWRIALINERVPISPDLTCVADMMIYPPLKHDCHFCGKECLKSWINKGETK